MPDKDNFQAVLCVRDRAGARNGKERDFVLFAIGNGQTDQLELHEIPGALNCMHDQQAILVFQAAGDRDNPTISVSDKAFCIPANAMSDRGQAVLCVALDRAAYNQGQNAQFDPGIDESGKAFTVAVRMTAELHSAWVMTEKHSSLFLQRTNTQFAIPLIWAAARRDAVYTKTSPRRLLARTAANL